MHASHVRYAHYYAATTKHHTARIRYTRYVRSILKFAPDPSSNCPTQVQPAVNTGRCQFKIKILSAYVLVQLRYCNARANVRVDHRHRDCFLPFSGERANFVTCVPLPLSTPTHLQSAAAWVSSPWSSFPVPVQTWSIEVSSSPNPRVLVSCSTVGS